MAASGLDHFYQRFGFQKKPNELMGPGMTRFHGRPGESSET